jgi:hypothetical protein
MENSRNYGENWEKLDEQKPSRIHPELGNLPGFTRQRKKQVEEI